MTKKDSYNCMMNFPFFLFPFSNFAIFFFEFRKITGLAGNRWTKIEMGKRATGNMGWNWNLFKCPCVSNQNCPNLGTMSKTWFPHDHFGKDFVQRIVTRVYVW